MHSYDTNVTIVLAKLNEVEYEQRVRDYHCRTYKEFREYLNENGRQYSSDTAHEWLQLSQKTCVPHIYDERFRSIIKLDDVYRLGHVRPPHLVHEKVPILPSFEDELAHFLSPDRTAYTKSSCKDYRMYCRRFLRFLQGSGITELSELSYTVIDEYFVFFSHDDPGTTMVGSFLFYLVDKGICTAGLYWYFHYHHEAWLLCPKDLTTEQNAIIETHRAESDQFPLDRYQEFLANFLDELMRLGYQSAVLLHAGRGLRLLLVFLEMGHLGYHKEIANVWYEANESNIGVARNMIKRTLQLFEDYTKAGSICATHIYRMDVSKTIPDWGKNALEAFIRQKEKEKHVKSTIYFYRSACIRFLNFLDRNGIHSYADITQIHIRQFNIADKHKTTYSKNAYACRIRKFLRFLERERLLVTNGLDKSLLPSASSGERIVITLTEEEKKKVHTYVQNAKTPIQLRDRAILLLGKDMGIRACDIVKLTFSSIDWKNRLIRFNQDKTDVESCLPMPVQVGNAIFSYIKEGRPKGANTSFIFVQSKAPYAPIGKHACSGALERALPGRKVPGSGFHVTRKTFSTDMLRGGAAPASIADALGHSTLCTVHKYLGLDAQRMCLCPMSLKDAGIPVKGGK